MCTLAPCWALVLLSPKEARSGQGTHRTALPAIFSSWRLLWGHSLQMLLLQAGSTRQDSWASEGGGGLPALQPALRGAEEVGTGLWRAPP